MWNKYKINKEDEWQDVPSHLEGGGWVVVFDGIANLHPFDESLDIYLQHVDGEVMFATAKVKREVYISYVKTNIRETHFSYSNN